MLVDQFVKNLNYVDRQNIIKDYEQFRRDGMIGECVLRTTTRRLMKQLGAENNITLWMEQLATACFRYYALKYLKMCNPYEGVDENDPPA